MDGVLTEQELLVRYLPAYIGGEELPSNGAISSNPDPYLCKPDKLPWSRAQGRLGMLFYTKRVQDDNNKRYVNDDSGYWKPVGGELSVLDGSKVVGFKRTFRFVSPENPSSEMTEYTIHSRKSGKNKKAIIAIRNAENVGR